jgi:UPF0271 protein
MLLNCDIGENESADLREQISPYLHALNIACGGHAGDDSTMAQSASLAARHALHAGAHPGLSGNFGRTIQEIDAESFLSLLDQQLKRLLPHLQKHDIPLHHVKLHGALYHISDATPQIAEAYISWMKIHHPSSYIIARCGGLVAHLCQERNHPILREGFLDRGYNPDGTLIPRGTTGDMIDDPAEILARWHHFPYCPCETLCLHADGSQALGFAKLIHASSPSIFT